MTTIAYDHINKVIAYDSRTTRGGYICSDNTEKKHVNGKLTFIMSGGKADIETYVREYSTGNVGKDQDCYGFFVEDGKVYWVTSDTTTGETLTSYLEYSESAGSGQDHAITALDCGKTAVEAVKLAIKRDNCSGGKVRTFKIKQ